MPTWPRPPAYRALTVALTALAGAAGCGGGSHASSVAQPPAPAAAAPAPAPAPAGPCSAAARTAIGGAVGVSAAGVAATGYVAPSGAAGCRFLTRRAAGDRRPAVGVVAEIDAAPQAEQRFERAVVEYGQNVLWTHERAYAYPRNIDGLGVGADWFPVDHRLLSTDGIRLVDITVTWPRAAPGRALGLAESLARRYIDAR